MKTSLAVSFVHGYTDLKFNLIKEKLPALWTIDSKKNSKVFSYVFPRNVSDFYEYKDVISGSMPLANAENFKKLPRFGLTGIGQYKNHLYCGSWNGVYEISKLDFSLKRILTNQMMNDCHGIFADEKGIITILTGKDTVLFTDFDGRIIDHFTVSNDLTIYKNSSLEEIDWRFLSKQFRGATGRWHLNYVQRFGDEIWLTSRNLGAFIVVNLKTFKAHIRTMNQKTVVMLHDGILYNNEYYFTSIDGKIIIASDPKKSKFNPREEIEQIDKFSRDLVCELIRLEETDYGREPNWCRGITCFDDKIFVTIDGRYGSDLSFGLLGINRTGTKFFESRLHWKDVGNEEQLRFVTGFDVICL